MTCARATPAQCSAKWALSSHFTLRSSHPALHTSHFTLHTSSHLKSRELFSPHLTSSQLFSSHPISSHMSSKPSSSQLFSSHPTLINLSGLLEVLLNSSQLYLHARKLLRSERSLFHKKPLGAELAFAHRSLDTDAFTQKSLCKILCATKLAQGTSQYYVVLQSLHTSTSPDTTSYYKACTKHFPVLQSLHKY